MKGGPQNEFPKDDLVGTDKREKREPGLEIMGKSQ